MGAEVGVTSSFVGEILGKMRNLGFDNPVSAGKAVRKTEPSFDEALKLAPQEKAIADSPILKGHLERMKKH